MTDRDDSFELIVDILREPAALKADLTARVMSEIERLPPGEIGAAPSRVPWLRRQWTIRLTPLRGLGLAAGLAALLLSARLLDRGLAPTASQREEEAPASRLTQFVLVAPEASGVTLVGDFNDWSMSATPLERAEGDGVWHVTVPLEPGRYRYAFVVNGSIWRIDPEAPAAEDEFGHPNSVVTVGGGGA